MHFYVAQLGTRDIPEWQDINDHQYTYSSKSPKPPWSFPPNGDGPPGGPNGGGPPSKPSIGPSFHGPEKPDIRGR